MLISFLREHVDMFAWKPTNMPCMPRELIKHSLNVLATTKLIKQKLRRFTQDKKGAIRVEITWLLAASFIKEVYHLEWLANLVLIRIKNKEWRMCIDYTDLNKYYFKDPFGLPRIDEVIDSTVSCELLCFLDCYSGYHQIALKEEDQIKTSFIMPFSTYCYMTMTFGLKNAGATYQRAIQCCLKDQIRKNIEAYIDDVVVKSKTTNTLIVNLTKVFKALKVY
jgi:hypothetical protein